MKLLAAAAVAAILLAAPAALAQNEASAIHRSQEASRAWLDLVDEGRYAASWAQSANNFRFSTTSAGWQAAVRNLREPLGPVRARRLLWANYTQTMPNAPAGEYVVLQYETRFENRVSVAEMVTTSREVDGFWKVAAYEIR